MVYSLTPLALCFLLSQLVLARAPGATPNKLLEYLLKVWEKRMPTVNEVEMMEIPWQRKGSKAQKGGPIRTDLFVQHQRITR